MHGFDKRISMNMIISFELVLEFKLHRDHCSSILQFFVLSKSFH